jgi:hypothetical protein
MCFGQPISPTRCLPGWRACLTETLRARRTPLPALDDLVWRRADS